MILNKEPTYLELFAGAGGLAEGFIKAGFYPVAHVEMDRHACDTLKTRLGYHYLRSIGRVDIYFRYIKGEISREKYYSNIPYEIISSVINKKIQKRTLVRLVKLIKDRMSEFGIKKINVIAGGPPCQAYSIIGRARDPYRMKKDPRNYLYKFYTAFLTEFKPDFFVFENVPGLISAGEGNLWKDIQDYFNKAGYEISWKLLNARDFGVLQNRKRIIVIGWRKDISGRFPEFEKNTEAGKYKVGDILNDLPPLQPGEKILVGEYIREPSEYLLNYGLRNKDDILTLHIARKHNERDRKIYKLCIEAWFRERRRLRYNELPEDLKTHRNREAFRDRFKVVAPDLPYSQTVVAHLAKDGHYFIHPDINQLRSISVREAARLQSFPDNYYFEGPMTAMFRQIGNAVPPLMARKIAEKIKEMLT